MKKLISKYAIKKNHSIAIVVFVFIALFHQIIANDKYIICKKSSSWSFFEKQELCEYGVRALIPYSSKTIDKDNRSVGPFDKQKVSSLYYRHWLGTDSIGRDVLAGLIWGSFIALVVGLVSSLLALLVGVLMAYLSGYIGDNGFKLLKTHFLILIPFSFVLTYYWIYASVSLKLVMFIMFVILIYCLNTYSKNQAIEKKRIGLPFDLIILRVIEVFKSIPNLFLILILLPLMGRPSYWNVVFIIAFLRWPIITRHLRAEILNVKNENYISSARSIGLSDKKIFLKYILPLTISPIIIVTAFGFSSAILLESTLSFLGIGVPLDQLSWGGILKEARYDFNSWWLAVFPGLCIFFLIYVFNSIGDTINDQLLRSNRAYE